MMTINPSKSVHTTKRRGFAVRRQISDQRQERLRRRRNRHRQERREKSVMKGTSDARTRRRRQNVTTDTLFTDMVNTSAVGNYGCLLTMLQIPYCQHH